MNLRKLASDVEGYLSDSETGSRAVFYVCDPAKNILCGKEFCRISGGAEEGKVGFCACTLEPTFQKEGTRAFYKRLNAQGYFGREYIEEV